jgi:predicted metalloprotease with PDZ domain
LLVAIDGERCTAANLAELLARRVAGDRIEVTYFRRDLLASVSIELPDPPANTCDLWLLPDESLDQQVLQRRRNWLSSLRKAG